MSKLSMLLVFIFALSPVVEAKRKKGPDRRTFRLVAQRTVERWGSATSGGRKLVCIKKTRSALEELRRKIDEGAYGDEYAGGLDYPCSYVETVVVTKNSSSSNWGSSTEFWLNRDYQGQSFIEIYCLPRKISERSIVSYSKNCELHPTPDCFTEENQARMDSLPLTIYEDDFSRSCLKDFRR